MIVPKSIEALYGRLAESMNLLKANVDQIFKNMADSLNITYVDARIKPKESLLAKIEKEGYKDPIAEIEDWVACRLVVKSNSNIADIIDRIKGVFNIERKNIRNYRPSEFIYDDIQLILSFKDSPLISNKEILGKKFELQIRTGLQDALAEAIRSEIYKTDTITWQKERTASELRANLELVDVLLSEFPKVSSIQEKKEYKPYHQRNEIIKLLKNNWEAEKLPVDLRRASIIIEDYLNLADTTIKNLIRVLNSSKYAHIIKAVSITPCQIILIILFLEKEAFLKNVIKKNRYIFITDEMIDICPELKKVDSSYRVNIN